jgi:hypothetical protein
MYLRINNDHGYFINTKKGHVSQLVPFTNQQIQIDYYLNLDDVKVNIILK